MPFYWQDREKDKLMVLRVKDSKNEWNWSGGFDITTPQTLTLLIRRKNSSDFLPIEEKVVSFFRVVIFKEKEIYYISIYQLKEKEYPYELKNNCKNFNLTCKQVDGENKEHHNNLSLKLMSTASMPFAWPFPNKPPEIEVSFFFKNQSEKQIPIRKIFNLTKFTKRKFKITNKKMIYGIEAKYSVDRTTIKLEFEEKIELGGEKTEDNEDVKKCFAVFFKEFGISLIAKNKDQKNIELGYIYMKVIIFLDNF